MKLTFNDPQMVKFLQEGGAMAPAEAPAEAPAPEEAAPAGGSPEEQIMAACQQALESQDCQLAMQVCQALLQMAGGGAAPTQAPEGQEPVYRKGGKLLRYQNKF